ncbi:AP-3 complex subunit beta-2-like [Oppia nitens]|uniref:AP-3 complex subunit beta-2-like n=1 Tax=Oppia nitens TaxID=1686743 RepID=UPI0023DAE3C8|nr:AP-3 complex subunit beta-2-like [Oppia nitens]
MSMSSHQTSTYHSSDNNSYGGGDHNDYLMSSSSATGGGGGGSMSHSWSDTNLMSMGSGGGGGGSSSPRTGMSSILAGSIGGTAGSSATKYEDLKQMLESNKDGLKLEAMKRLIGMVAKGRSPDSARELFAPVVKNVVTKNAELKKLVYLYLSRYAEQEQDLALLSIATFQRSLKDPNPLIRASAIRVLSSIRVPIIAPIMLIAIRDCSNDMSPYVRKTACHAIPKLWSLEPDLKNEIVDIIERLLNDRTALVLGSAVAAFEEVCADRIDLIHQNYRKFCSLLVDVDEWGQIILINMLIRYSRTQFLDPNPPRPTTATTKASAAAAADIPVLDADHRLLLRSAKPLLQSRNSGVVLAVIQLYLSLSPQNELNSLIVKPLIRLLHSHREIQLVVLKNIVTLTTTTVAVTPVVANGGGDDGKDKASLNQNDLTNKCDTELMDKENTDAINQTETKKTKDSDEDEEEEEEDEEDFLKFDTTGGGRTGYSSSDRSIRQLFEPYLKSFFIKAKDSTQSKILKLEILTNLSNSVNISLILREFQAYIMNYQEDLEFMAATIQAIGHIAARIAEIAPICLNGLIRLLSNRNESIVSHSIVVIRTQIINKEESIISAIIKQVVRLMDKITTPQARATIVWILAEFCPVNDRAARYAPDVLRKLAKTFCQEADTVKLQSLNLAGKLMITQDTSDRIKLLVNFLFNLAKYDLNYDVRDRGRFLRQLLNEPELAKRILLVPKQVPDVGKHSSGGGGGGGVGGVGSSDSSRQFRIGTMSHFLAKKATDYEELPDWPLEQPDPNVRQRKEVYTEPELTSTFAKVSIKDQTAGGAGGQRKSGSVKKLLKEKSFYSSEESDDSESDEVTDDDEDDDEEVTDEDMSDEEEDEEITDEEDDEELEESDDEEESEEDEEGSDDESEGGDDSEEEEGLVGQQQVVRPNKPNPTTKQSSVNV